MAIILLAAPDTSEGMDRMVNASGAQQQRHSTS